MLLPSIFVGVQLLLLLPSPDGGVPVVSALPDQIRPACKLEIVGLLWPPEANTQPALLHKLAREGRLTICSRGTWRYRWTSPSVHVNQLRSQTRSEGEKNTNPAATAEP